MFYLKNWLAYLISECKVDSFLCDIDGPDLGVDDHFVGVCEPAHVSSNLKNEQEQFLTGFNNTVVCCC